MMKTKYAALIIAVLVTVMLAISAYAQAMSMVSLSSQTFQIGESGIVEALIDCGNQACSLFDITIEFDTSKVRVDSFELGT